MARCETGYLCDVCGAEVEHLVESGLYLRYVIGELDPETLHIARERHIRCHPALAQFIVDNDYPPLIVEGPLDKRQLDPTFVGERERLVTQGWRRLRELPGSAESILEYPLSEVRAAWGRSSP